MSTSDSSATAGFKTRFVRGLAILLPSILTLWLLWQIAAFVFVNVAQPINAGIRAVVVGVAPLIMTEDETGPAWFNVSPNDMQRKVEEINDDPARVDVGDRTGRLTPAEQARVRTEIRRGKLEDYWNRHWYLEATGLLVAISLIYFAGLLLGNFLGRQIYAKLENLISRVPGFKQIYPHVKQLVDLVLGEKKIAFQKVVLVEYPGPGIWSIGFLTGGAVRQIDGPAGGRVRSVFIPNSPTPFTGFTINVREDRIIEMDMPVDQALRFVITAGVLTPESAKGPPTLFDQSREPGAAPGAGRGPGIAVGSATNGRGGRGSEADGPGSDPADAQPLPGPQSVPQPPRPTTAAGAGEA